MTSSKIRNRFLAFAETECKGNSELYDHLSQEIAKDEALLKLASFTRLGQPVPNIFFAAVHYLLLKDPAQELASYYPSITKQPATAILPP